MATPPIAARLAVHARDDIGSDAVAILTIPVLFATVAILAGPLAVPGTRRRTWLASGTGAAGVALGGALPLGVLVLGLDACLLPDPFVGHRTQDFVAAAYVPAALAFAAARWSTPLAFPLLLGAWWLLAAIVVVAAAIVLPHHCYVG